MRNPETAHWRDSGRIPKFFILDAYSAIPLVFFLLHIRIWTLILTCSISVFFMLLNRFGFSLPVFRRWLRSFIAGEIRESQWRSGHKH